MPSQWDKLRQAFDNKWLELAQEGKVDAFGSAQYERIAAAFSSALPRHFAELWLEEQLKGEGHAPPAHGHQKKKHNDEK